MNNKKIISLVAGIVVLVAVFYGGMVYGKSKTPARGTGAFTRGAGTLAGGRAGGTGGFVGGQIIAKDATSITVQLMANGPAGTATGSKIILLSSGTKVSKQADGTLNDLAVGTTVSVTGTPNSDGSITAQSVQIRPNMPQNARVQ